MHSNAAAELFLTDLFFNRFIFQQIYFLTDLFFNRFIFNRFIFNACTVNINRFIFIVILS